MPYAPAQRLQAPGRDLRGRGPARPLTVTDVVVSGMIGPSAAATIAISLALIVLASCGPAWTNGTEMPVFGICNGFQILCEAHLLPGALTRNAGLYFIARDLRLRWRTRAPRGRGPTAAASRSWCR
jgi:hypothetical protein